MTALVMKPERWQRIEHMYHAALESAPDQRSAFLAEACADDDALRREVEKLILANEQAGGFLAAPALELEAKNLAAENSGTTTGFQAGQSLSHYTIASRIGAGGMGEVFLARDRVLGRRVALKLLPLEFTQNAERLQRFVREAKSASGLNHPNIITIYEIGEVATDAGNTHFIATEFIEGETLRTWKVDPEKRLPQALNIAVQIASALDAAHKAGIVHRDIKPENVMVRPDGLVKVLDFGLAKLTARAMDSSDSSAPTLVEGVKTRPGVILGTLRYMSPEQARGRNLDARSDIFSLGVVLYELLTGEPLFAGDTDADVVAAIIHREAPSLTQRLPEALTELERIVQKTLAKDVEQRYQNARDLLIDLQSLMRDSELSVRVMRSGATASGKLTAQTSSVLAAPRFSLRQLLLVAPVVLLLAGAIWWALSRGGNVVETPPIASLQNIEVIRWASVPGEAYSSGSFSPDGKWIAFTSTKSGTRNIWVRQTVSGDEHQSTKDEFHNEFPIWSPGGDEIAFFSWDRGGKPGIWRMPMLGGALTLIKVVPIEDPVVRLLRWSTDGKTIYYDWKRQLIALDIQSGETKQITSLDPAQVTISSLSLSRDEQQISYITAAADGRHGIWFMPVHGGAAKRVVDTTAVSRNTVWHPDGERLCYSSRVNGINQVFVADTNGRQPAQITFGDRDSLVVDVSSDGARVLYGSSEEQSDLWGVNLAKPDEFVVASDITCELWPDISPDSKSGVYQAVRNLSQGSGIYNGAILIRAIGDKAEPFELAKNGYLPKWSPDGRQIAFVRRENQITSLKTINVSGGEERTLVTSGLQLTPYSVLPYLRMETSDFSWSPNGSQLACCVSGDGVQNLHLISTDGSGDAQITDNRDAQLIMYCPIWSGDAKRIAFGSRPARVATPQDNIYSIWVVELETKIAKPLVRVIAGDIHLLGWLADDQELLLARNLQKGISLWRVSLMSGKQSLVTEAPWAKPFNVHLSPNGRLVAYVSNEGGEDNLHVIPSEGGVERKLTANKAPHLYFSTLAWSPDSRAIYFGKQSRYSLLSMIANFK